jgi:hypothetical protein
MNDEYIQENLDGGKTDHSQEGKEYNELFKQLDTIPESGLTPGFAHRVTARLEADKKTDPIRRWIIIVGSVLGVFIVGVFAVIGFGLNWGLPESSGLNLYLMFFSALIIIAVYTYFEKRSRPSLYDDQ